MCEALTSIIMYFPHEVHDINTLLDILFFETTGSMIAFTARGFTLQVVSLV